MQPVASLQLRGISKLVRRLPSEKPWGKVIAEIAGGRSLYVL